MLRSIVFFNFFNIVNILITNVCCLFRFLTWIVIQNISIYLIAKVSCLL